MFEKCNKVLDLGIDAVSGCATGMICTGFLNPYDRALYLSVKDNVPFLSKSNFRNPYKGVVQAIIQRGLLGGGYYVFQSQGHKQLYPFFRNELSLNEAAALSGVGIIAGSISGVLITPLSAVKYYTWGHERSGFLNSAKSMWHAGGIGPFRKGISASVSRDTIFGCVYEPLRHYLFTQLNGSDLTTPSPYLTFASNMFAAGVATMTSSPLNYVRSIQFSIGPSSPTPSIVKILHTLTHDLTTQKTLIGKIGFFRQKMNIGWGTLRVGLGMGLGQECFQLIKTQLESSVSKP